MSANDQRPRGQPSHVSNGSGSKEEEAYLQQQPPHPMRAWGEQASDGGYGAGPMSTAVSDSFFPNYYPPNMSYPFMSQGMSGSEGAWSSGADTMFGMGYDYSNMYSGFGFPFNNWDYSGDYWGSSQQPVRKDQRGYPTEEAYYPPEMIPADSYGMVNGAPPPANAPTATAAPVAESQEQVASVEQGIRDMRLAYRKDNMMPPQHQHQHQQPPPPPQHQQQNQRQPPPPPQQQQPPQQQHHQPQHQPTHHLQHVVAEGFTGEPSFMMPPSPVSATVSPSGGQSSIGVGSSNSSSNTGGGGDQSSGGQSSSSSSSKKTSWAAIASQPARPQLQMRPRTIPRAPVHPGKSHNMDIGTWDTRGNPSRPGPVPMTISQPLPNQPPSSMAARYSRQPLISQRQTMPPPPPSAAASVSVSNSSNNNNTSSSGGGDNSNFNSSSSYGGSSSNTGMDGGSGSGVVHDNAANVSSDSGSGGNVVTAIGSDSNNSNMASSGGGNSSSSYSGRYSSNNASGSAADSANSRAVVNVNASMNGMHGSSGDSSSPPQAPTPVVDGSGGGSSEKASSSTFYNPKEFVLNHKSARYFIIKSYSEDDIHRSIKYSVWCSTDHGNRRLDAAFREREGKGPVYLIFSVNGSGHFCGVAQMMTAVDYNKSTGIWHQDKWKGQIEVKWVYVKDVPNGQLRHIRLENNENKPVTNSRDTQEVPPEKGKQVLRIMHSYKATTSIFDDFSHYEKRQEEDRLLTQNREHRGGDHRGERGGGHHGGDRRGGGGDRGGDRGDRGDRGGDGDNYHRGGGDRDRDHHHHNQHHRGGGGDRGGDRDGRDNHHNHHRGGGGGGGNNEHRNQGGYRNDYNNRGGDRDGGRGDRDNRDHHHQHHHNQRYEGGRGGGGDDRNDNNNRDRGDRGGPRGGFDREIRGRPGGINDREPRRGGFRQH